MEIYKDKYIKYIYEKENSLLIFYWSKETENMSNNKYKELIIKGVGFTKTYQPKYLINNSLDKRYIALTEMQDWVVKNALSKIFENGVRKYAITKSKEFFVQVSTKLAVDEDDEKQYRVMFFENERKAKKWCNK